MTKKLKPGVYTMTVDGKVMPNPVTLRLDPDDRSQYLLDGVAGSKRSVSCWRQGEVLMVAQGTRPVVCTLVPV